MIFAEQSPETGVSQRKSDSLYPALLSSEHSVPPILWKTQSDLKIDFYDTTQKNN